MDNKWTRATDHVRTRSKEPAGGKLGQTSRSGGSKIQLKTIAQSPSLKVTSSFEDEEIEVVTFDGDRWGGGTSSKANSHNNNKGAVLFYWNIQMPVA